jgi:hypothetical protein
MTRPLVGLAFLAFVVAALVELADNVSANVRRRGEDAEKIRPHAGRP